MVLTVTATEAVTADVILIVIAVEGFRLSTKYKPDLDRTLNFDSEKVK